MVFKSEQELKNFLLKKCQIAIAEAEQKVYQIIDGCLKEFYGEFEPAEYIRTAQLLHSLVRTGIRQDGSGFIAEVYFDAGELNYKQGLVELKSGGLGLATWDAETVLKVAMTGDYGHKPHGGYESGTAIWSDSMNKLGNIFELLERELKAQGIPIKKK